jgi:hypothetical protein
LTQRQERPALAWVAVGAGLASAIPRRRDDASSHCTYFRTVGFSLHFGKFSGSHV